MGQHTALLDTPTEGRAEARAVLQRVHAYGGRTATPQRLLRHLPPRTALADLTTALDAVVSDDEATLNAGAYALTDDGLIAVRVHPTPPFVPIS